MKLSSLGLIRIVPTSVVIALSAMGMQVAQADNSITQAGGTVNNSDNIVATNNGITLTASGTVINTGTVTAVNQAILIQGTGVVNSSNTITSTGNSGIFITQDGTVTLSGDLTASNYGVNIGGNGTVTNSANLLGKGNNGVFIAGNGTVTNSMLIRSNANSAIVIQGVGNITNSGTINGSKDTGILVGGSSTVLTTITNTVDGVIKGITGIAVNGVVSITNAGNINSTGNSAIIINNAGTTASTINNTSTGSINSSVSGIQISGLGNVINAGTIKASNDGVDLFGGGTFTSTGGKTEGDNNGVFITGGSTPYTVTITDGTVKGKNNDGLFLNGDSTVGISSPGAVVGGNNGIFINGNGTVNASGSITGNNNAGIYVQGNGIISVTSPGSITGDADGIEVFGGGSLNNSGTIVGTKNIGAYFAQSASVTNSGIIAGNKGAGVEIDSTGNVTNSGGGLIVGKLGVFIVSDGSVTNSGIIAGTGKAGVEIDGIGNVSNSNLIVGNNGVLLSSTGSVTNTGSIIGTNTDGIQISGDGSVTNSGSINGDNNAINIKNSGTVKLLGGSLSSNNNLAIRLNANGGAPSSVTVIGRASITGKIKEENGIGTIVLNLSGLTPAALAQLQAANGATSGTITIGSNVYDWKNLTLVARGVSLEQVVDSGLVDLATRIDNTNQGLPASYDALYVAAAIDPEGALNQLVGRQILQGYDTLGVSRLTQVAYGLNQIIDNQSGPVGGLDLTNFHVNSDTLVAFNDSSSRLNSLIGLGEASLGGATMSDSPKTMVCNCGPKESWGVWASGNVTFANESPANSIAGYNATIGSPTFGVEYVIDPNFTIGALVNYTTGTANFSDGSQLNTDSELCALYGTWRDGPWHVNTVAGVGPSQYSMRRPTLGGTANAGPDGLDVLTDSTAGYEFNLGDKWTVTPELGLQYTHLDVDGYAEGGAGAFNLNVGNQSIDSLRSHLGFHMDRAYDLGSDLQFIPQLRAVWYHEFLDDSRGVSTSLPGAPALGSFSVRTFGPERDFAIVGVGLNTVYTGYRGIPVGMFVDYSAQVGQDNYIAHSVEAGLKVSF